LRYRKVSQTVHSSWLLAIQEGKTDCCWLAIREGELDCTLLLICYTGRWARLCYPWLAIQEGEPDYITLDFLWYRKVSQATLLLTSCGTGRLVRHYVALDLRHRKVSQTVYCSWLLAKQEDESDCTLLLTSSDTGRWDRLYIALDFLWHRKVSQTVHCSWLLVIQKGESDCTLLLTSSDIWR
jgi:hypothetical protein